jgi:hypothetical protein
MKNTHIIWAFIIIIVIGILIFFGFRKEKDVAVIPPAETASIEGCYTARIINDVYTLNIQSQEGEKVSGTLAFKNFEKDSSSGTFAGTYKDGILLGDYAFRSEGMDSVTQVIFKKMGDNFVRGYGDVDGSGTHFTDLKNITYDASSPLSLFKKTACAEAAEFDAPPIIKSL